MERGMSNENLNDHWINKLEDVSRLSGETFIDKNAAWEKLHSRLLQKPQRINALWFWAAAACFLLALIIPANTFNKKQEGLVQNVPLQILPKKITATEILILKENAVAKISTSLIEKKEIPEPSIKSNNKKAHANDLMKIEQILSATISDQPDIQKKLPTLNPPIINTPVETTFTLATVKKKLEVVHINELSDPGEEASNIARYYERRSFKLKLINKEVYTSSALPVKYTGFNILKLKNAPSN